MSFTGRSHTPETRAAIAARLKGRGFSPEHRRALSLAGRTSEKAKHQRDLACVGARAVCLGRKESEVTRRRKSLAKLGKQAGPMPDAVRKKISMTKRTNWAMRETGRWVL